MVENGSYQQMTNINEHKSTGHNTEISPVPISASCSLSESFRRTSAYPKTGFDVVDNYVFNKMS